MPLDSARASAGDEPPRSWSYPKRTRHFRWFKTSVIYPVTATACREETNARIDVPRKLGTAEDVPDLERRAAWLAEDWRDCPEFSCYRDMLLMYRLAAEPSGNFAIGNRESATAVIPRLRFLHLDFAKKNARFVVTIGSQRRVPGHCAVQISSGVDLFQLAQKRTPGPAPSGPSLTGNVEDASATVTGDTTPVDAIANEAQVDPSHLGMSGPTCRWFLRALPRPESFRGGCTSCS